MEPVDLTLTLLRIWLGVVMAAHGINHARSLDRTARWFGSVGFRAPRRHAQLSAFGEVAIGVSLIGGIATSFGLFGLVAIVAVAFWSIHRAAGFFVFSRPDEGYEYVVTLVGAALLVAALGPGPFSLDARVGVADALDGWTGVVIVLFGLVAAAGQLVSFWRRPDE